MGPLGLDARGRQRARSGRAPSLAASADGPLGAGVPRLSEFPDLPRVEPVDRLFDQRGVSGDADQWRARDASRQQADRGGGARAEPLAAGAAGKARPRRRQDRWLPRPEEPRRREGGAGQAGAAGGQLSDAGAGGEVAGKVISAVILRWPRSGPRRMATNSGAHAIALRGSPQGRLAPQGDGYFSNTAVISHTISCPPSSAVCEVCRAGRACGSGNIFTHSALSTSRVERSFIHTFIFMMSSVEPSAAVMIART